MASENIVNLQLPSSMVGLDEIGQVLREIDLIEGQLMQQRIYKDEMHNSTTKVLSVSDLLSELAATNRLDLDDNTTLSKLKNVLSDVKKHAPVVHMGLARESTKVELKPVIDWMRSNIHPNVLLNIGLRPDIIGGCTIRTANHYYDFSLKNYFETARIELLTKIKAL